MRIILIIVALVTFHTNYSMELLAEKRGLEHPSGHTKQSIQNVRHPGQNYISAQVYPHRISKTSRNVCCPLKVLFGYLKETCHADEQFKSRE